MQRILSEDEYQELKIKSERFDEARKSITDSIREEITTIYAYGRDGIKLMPYDKVVNTFDFNICKIFKLLDIEVPPDITVQLNIKNS
jgi:hypothetical protein